MNDALATAAPSQMVPGDFAEKAMASLMQMHSELMDEKERRVELFRKLMEREQIVAELRMYVKLLEEKLHPPKVDREVERRAATAGSGATFGGSDRRVELKVEPRSEPQPVPARPLSVEIPSVPSAHARAPEVAPPVPQRVSRPKVDNWKTW